MQSSQRRFTFAVAARWGTQLAYLAANLYATRILFRNLPAPELGVWFLFLSARAVMEALEPGFAPALARFVAFAHGRTGAVGEGEGEGEPSDELARLRDASRRIFAGVGMGGALLLAAGGELYLQGLGLDAGLREDARAAWLLFAATFGLSLYVKRTQALLSGLGDVGLDALVYGVAGVFQALGSCVLAQRGAGILALSLLWCGTLAAAHGVLLVLARVRHPELGQSGAGYDARAAGQLWAPAWRRGLLNAGALAMGQLAPFAAARWLGPAEVPVLYAALSLGGQLRAFLLPFGLDAAPFVSRAYAAGDGPALRRAALGAVNAGGTLALSGSALLAAAGDLALLLWLGPDAALEPRVWWCLAAAKFLEHHTWLWEQILQALDVVPWREYLASGALTLVALAWLTPRWGLAGTAAALGMGQALAAGWSIPYQALRRLEVGVAEWLMGVVPPWILLVVFPAAALYGLELLGLTALPRAGIAVAGEGALALVVLLRQRRAWPGA